jgi:putative restriction endonuclease
MTIGALPGIQVGLAVLSRRELHGLGLHRDIRRGICGSGIPGRGAESIVLSGGYEDDIDLGALIYYTGQGGRDRRTGLQIEDQAFVGPNLSLALNVDSRTPVRVIRRQADGFTYSGLYLVQDAWLQPGRSGFAICRYRLFAESSDPLKSEPARRLPGAAPRREATHYRLVRDSAVAAAAKSMYGQACQVCGRSVTTLTGPYAEAAHVIPLGHPFDGPDVLANVLCLCPNHHASFDHGGLYVRNDLAVIEVGRGAIGQLILHPGHGLDAHLLAQHRAMFGHSDVSEELSEQTVGGAGLVDGPSPRGL